MVELKNRRIGVKVGRTIKDGEKYEFYKFELSDEGDIPKEIADDEQARAIRDEMFRNLNEEAIVREAAIKAIHDKGAIDKIVVLLRKIFSGVPVQEEVKPDPPVYYYGPNDLVDDNEQMSTSKTKE
jgi:hypothetical protein